MSTDNGTAALDDLLARIASAEAGEKAGQEGRPAKHWDPASPAHARRRRTPKHPPPGWTGPRVMKR
jgi:hypothetical protein